MSVHVLLVLEKKEQGILKSNDNSCIKLRLTFPGARSETEVLNRVTQMSQQSDIMNGILAVHCFFIMLNIVLLSSIK